MDRCGVSRVIPLRPLYSAFVWAASCCSHYSFLRIAASNRPRPPSRNPPTHAHALTDSSVCVCRPKAGCKTEAASAAREVLLDVLLLARCNFLLSGASGVSELAVYFNPRLHHDSLNLAFRYGQQHHWLYTATTSEHGRRDRSAGRGVQATKRRGERFNLPIADRKR